MINQTDKNISRSKKIWIDLENSPHVLFFNPIIKELKNRGYQVVVTARDYAQVYELAELFGIKHKKIGRHFGRNKILKVVGLIHRVLKLIDFMMIEKPDIAFSHVSRSQFLAAKLFRIPSVMATDYEHVKHLPFIKPDLLLMPQVLYEKNKNGNKAKTSGYIGIKENVYVQNFVPDSSILNKLGINNGEIIATLRPPATQAHYHNPESERLFVAIIDFLSLNQHIKMVIVPRTKDQAEFIKKKWEKHINVNKIIIPNQALNGLDLVWFSDLVISGGGTMIREAAAVNVPAYSFFKGKIGAVDHYLAKAGLLTLIENERDVYSKISLKHRYRPEHHSAVGNITLHNIVDQVLGVL